MKILVVKRMIKKFSSFYFCIFLDNFNNFLYYFQILHISFSISNLKKESINFFNIKIYTLKQLITFLNSQAGIQAKAIGETIFKDSI